jgi:hypothetical protein
MAPRLELLLGNAPEPGRAIGCVQALEVLEIRAQHGRHRLGSMTRLSFCALPRRTVISRRSKSMSFDAKLETVLQAKASAVQERHDDLRYADRSLLDTPYFIRRADRGTVTSGAHLVEMTPAMSLA